MDWSEHPLLNKFILAIPIFLAVNVLVLDIALVIMFMQSAKQEKRLDFLSHAVTAPATIPSPTEVMLTTEPSPAPKKNVSVQTSGSQNTGAREFYIPLGTSSFYSVDDWGDVTGAQAYVDSNNFQPIKNVSFEALVHVPDAVEDVSVRLYNDTDKHPVWLSELFFPSGTTKNFLISSPILLDPGVKLYKVQMKTQFKKAASLDQARIHITIK